MFCFFLPQPKFPPFSALRPTFLGFLVHTRLFSTLPYPVLVSRSRSHLALFRCPPPRLSFPPRLLPHQHHVPVPDPDPDPVPVSVSAPESYPAPDLVRVFPSHAPSYPFGSMCVYRHRALRTELSGARKHHPLSAEIMTRTE